MKENKDDLAGKLLKKEKEDAQARNKRFDIRERERERESERVRERERESFPPQRPTCQSTAAIACATKNHDC